MKRKLGIILACMLLACLVTGCASQNNSDNGSSQSNTSQTSGAESQTASGGEKTSDAGKTESAASQNEKSTDETGSELPDPDSDIIIDIDGDGEGDPGVSIDEDGNITIDPEQFSGWEEDSDGDGEIEEPDDPLSEIQYMLLALSPDGFGTGLDKPAAYTITSEEELSKFIQDNDAKYSLSKEYGDSDGDFVVTSFKAATADSTADFFEGTDMLVIVTPYSKNGFVDLGDLYADENGSINAVIWAEEPKDANDKAYACLIVEVSKDALKGKTVNAVIDPNAYMEEPEEGEGEVSEEVLTD